MDPVEYKDALNHMVRETILNQGRWVFGAPNATDIRLVLRVRLLKGNGRAALGPA